MPKMKTKKAAAKRFKLTKKGKVKAKQAYTSHMMMNKSKKMKRQARGLSTLSKVDAESAKQWLPYAKKGGK